MERLLDIAWNIRFGTMRTLLRVCLFIIGSSGVDLVAEAASVCVERRD